MRFEPDDEDGFYAARDALVERFESSAEGRELGWVASPVLDFKWGYLGGDLDDWMPDDIEEILLGLYPAKVMLDAEDLDAIPAAFAAFLRFLGNEGILGVRHAAALADQAAGLGGAFRAAALDETNWSMGKRLWSQAQGEGVDITDESSIQRFMDEFNRRPFAARDAILGSLPGMGGPAPGRDGGSMLSPLPPVVLAPDEELEEAARETVVLRRLARLVHFVGEGRSLTQKGNLKLADGKELVDLLETGDVFDPESGDRVWKTKSTVELGGVDLTFRLAVESHLLTVDRGKVIRGTHASLLDVEPLEALYGAWLGLLHGIGPTRYRYRVHHYHFDWYAEDLDEYLLVLLVDLYRSGDDDIADLAEDSWEHLNEIYDLSGEPAAKLEFHRSLVESSLRAAFDLLAELGTVRVYDMVETPTQFGSVEHSGGSVGLTPLGMWTVQRLASRVTSAPVVGALRNVPAAELLATAADLPEPEATVEIDAWIDHHGTSAAAQLVAALPGADETGRGLAFRALLRIGPDAAVAVGVLGDDPDLAPYVTVWRVDTLTAATNEIDSAGDPERFVRLLHAVTELWGPEAAAMAWAASAAGAPGLPAMLDQAWRVQRSETEDVLAAIGGHHPDKSIAKAARKALFKYRTPR